MHKAANSLSELLSPWPPQLVLALFARNRSKARVAEATKRSGLAPRTFRRIAAAPNWDNVKLAQVDAFCRGCGFNPFRYDGKRYLVATLRRQRPFRHLSFREVERLNRVLANTQSKPKPKIGGNDGILACSSLFRVHGVGPEFTDPQPEPRT